MSRSNPTTNLTNPCKYWLKWDSDNKQFKYYDKEADNPESKSGKGKNFEIPLPFKFLVLDTLHTVGGYSDGDQKGIWANEVRNPKTDKLAVYIGSDKKLEGLWKESVKDKLPGMKYAQSVYILMKDPKGGKEMVLGNIKMMGAMLGTNDPDVKRTPKIDSGWFKFCKENRNILEGAVAIKETVFIEKNKKVNWNEPVFIKADCSPETEEKAKEVDAELQKYLTEYFAKGLPQDEIKDEPVAQVADTDFAGGEPAKSAREIAMDKQAKKDAENPLPEWDDMPF